MRCRDSSPVDSRDEEEEAMLGGSPNLVAAVERIGRDSVSSGETIGPRRDQF